MQSQLWSFWKLVNGVLRSVAWLSARLPLEGVALHARWSGEAAWIPIEHDVALDYENSTSFVGKRLAEDVVVPHIRIAVH
jgi:hypothetical protein